MTYTTISILWRTPKRLDSIEALNKQLVCKQLALYRYQTTTVTTRAASPRSGISTVHNMLVTSSDGLGDGRVTQNAELRANISKLKVDGSKLQLPHSQYVSMTLVLMKGVLHGLVKSIKEIEHHSRSFKRAIGSRQPSLAITRLSGSPGDARETVSLPKQLRWKGGEFKRRGKGLRPKAEESTETIEQMKEHMDQKDGELVLLQKKMEHLDRSDQLLEAGVSFWIDKDARSCCPGTFSSTATPIHGGSGSKREQDG
ncbi:hypothetical protein B0O80DRAFT_493407 [Mortierella sp. GBAus27b]|nr:hypothetical protein B0O80DRAFT_493407 [Mortierella sp. GBAus27b]